MNIGLENLLESLQSEGALIIEDMLAGHSDQKVLFDLAPTELDVPIEALKHWQIFGGTRQPKETNPKFVEKRRLDGFFIYYSPAEACIEYCSIRSQKKAGFTDFSTLPDTCLPIAYSIFGELLVIQCGSQNSFKGHLFHYDPPTGEHSRVSVSLSQYFHTVQTAFESKILNLDEKREIDVTDFDAYFALASKMNPNCDYWVS